MVHIHVKAGHAVQKRQGHTPQAPRLLGSMLGSCCEQPDRGRPSACNEGHAGMQKRAFSALCTCMLFAVGC
jgi:hypothetical protein